MPKTTTESADKPNSIERMEANDRKTIVPRRLSHWEEYGPMSLLFGILMLIAALAACIGWIGFGKPTAEWVGAVGSLLAGTATVLAVIVAWATYRRAQIDKRERDRLEKLSAARMVSVKAESFG